MKEKIFKKNLVEAKFLSEMRQKMRYAYFLNSNSVLVNDKRGRLFCLKRSEKDPKMFHAEAGVILLFHENLPETARLVVSDIGYELTINQIRRMGFIEEIIQFALKYLKIEA